MEASAYNIANLSTFDFVVEYAKKNLNIFIFGFIIRK